MMHISPSWRIAAVAAAIGAFAGAWALADYVVVLKTGGAILAKEPYSVEGKRAVIRGADGQLVSVALSDIDAERTREANSANVVVAPRADLALTPPVVASDQGQSPARGRGKVIDNFALRGVKGGTLNVGPEGEEGEGEEEGEEGEKPPTLEDIRTKEQDLNKMVEAINAKVKESVERGIGNYPAQKRLEEEVNQLRSSYEQEWKAYTDSVERYNANIPGAVPPASGGTGEGAEEGAAPEAAEESAPAPAAEANSSEAEESEGGEEYQPEPGEPLDTADPDSR